MNVDLDLTDDERRIWLAGTGGRIFGGDGASFNDGYDATDFSKFYGLTIRILKAAETSLRQEA